MVVVLVYITKNINYVLTLTSNAVKLEIERFIVMKYELGHLQIACFTVISLMDYL